LWFVVCGLWFVVCGLWFVVCGLWFVVCGLWFVVVGCLPVDGRHVLEDDANLHKYDFVDRK
jgi:glucose dehydrogenase